MSTVIAKREDDHKKAIPFGMTADLSATEKFWTRIPSGFEDRLNQCDRVIIVSTPSPESAFGSGEHYYSDNIFTLTAATGLTYPGISKVENHWKSLIDYQPRTVLGEKLSAIRKKILASGAKLLDWDEIEQEVIHRRGEREEL